MNKIFCIFIIQLLSLNVWAVQYEVIHLEGFPWVYSINDNGVVVGNSSDDLYVWDKSNGLRIIDLNAHDVDAMDINNNGQIVGSVSFARGEYPQAFVYNISNDSFLLIGGADWATAINDNGVIVGQMSHPDHSKHAFSYDTQNSSPSLIDLGTIGNNASYAYDINNSGQIVGYGYLQESHPYVWETGIIHDLYKESGILGTGARINEQGNIVGRLDNGHAFYFDGNRLVEIGTFGGGWSFIRGINDNNQLVGGAHNVHGNYRALIWQDGIMTDLNTLIPADLGMTLWYANDINNLGQIIALGDRGAVLLNPVPEPVSLIILTLGGLLLRRTK